MYFAIIYLSSRTYFISRRYNSLTGLFRSFSSRFKFHLCALVRVFVCVQRERERECVCVCVCVCVRACVRARVRVCVRGGGGWLGECVCMQER